jgi:hypothetical protein
VYEGWTTAGGGGDWSLTKESGLHGPNLVATQTDIFGNTSEVSGEIAVVDNDADGMGDAVDPDDDNDGLVDGSDSCPLIEEDFDGFEDADGCPDPDNDVDGICDPGMTSLSCSGSDEGRFTWSSPLPATEDCRNVPEDFDGFHDDDGCPEPDNDVDGHPDSGDDCPGTDWTAGPDGIADTGDEPLNELSVPIQTKEDYDGVLDIDGCHDSPGDDYDEDGWTDELEALEIGTNPALACPLTAIADDEEPDPWPPDFNDDRFINVTDVFKVLPPVFGSSPGNPDTNDDGIIDWSPRADLNPDGFINITDVFKVLPPFFGQSCTP